MTQTRNVILAGSFAFWASAASAQQAERYTLPAERSAIYNLVGEIQVQAGAGRDVVVELTRGGRDASQLTVRQDGSSTSDNLRVIYPASDIVYPRMSRGSNSSFQVTDDGRFSGRKDGSRRGRRGRDWDEDHVTVRGSGRASKRTPISRCPYRREPPSRSTSVSARRCSRT